MMYVISFFILLGSGFALVAALGVVRMPDLFCRMHSATKAGAFGVALILLGLVAASPEPRMIIQAAMIIVFFYLTAPVAAQMISRVALKDGSPQWGKSQSAVAKDRSHSPDK